MSPRSADDVEAFLVDLGSAPVPAELVATIARRLRDDRPGRQTRTAPWLLLASALAVLVVAALAWCGASPGPGPTPLAAVSASVHSSPTPTSVVSGSPSSVPSNPPRSPGSTPVASAAPNATTPGVAPTDATDDGLQLSIRQHGGSINPGGTLTVDVTIHNGRARDVVYSVTCGSATTMATTLPLPLDPSGRVWTGPEGHLKALALGEGNEDGESPDQVQTSWYSGSCATGDAGERTLAAGGTIRETLRWSATLVAGVAALPGDVPFTVTFAHDRLNGPPSYPPGYSGPIGSWFAEYHQLTVAGHIQVVGGASNLLSKGQAVDAVLSNPRFAAWLREQPESTWSVVNLLLQNVGQTSIVPAGPSWELDVFREQGVPRNFALAFVNPVSGAVHLNVCAAPCSR